MSEFAEKNFDAKGYDNNRPSYPQQFYRILDEYHKGPRNRLIDVGCGPGTATFQLADYLKPFDEIIGTDVSATMVARSVAHLKENPEKYKGVTFEISPADNFGFMKESDKKCDMITAVECAHWFDFENFQTAAFEILRKGGTLAIWGYSDPIFPEYPKLDGLLDNFTYGPHHIGPFWGSGRQILRNSYRGLHLRDDLFEDLEEGLFDADYIRSNQDNPILIKKTISLNQFQDYIKTWSAYHSWKKSHPEVRDITDSFCDAALELYPQLTKQLELQVVWKSFFKLCRKL